MADFTALKTAIQQYIAQNGNKEITGNLLQTILLAMVQSMGDQAINGVLQMLSNEMIAREHADGFLSQALTAEQQRAIAAETKSAVLDGETKTLVFKNAAGQELYQVGVASLISNGLVDVEVDGTNLVMTFHTESGNEEITIPISDIFNPSNYYTKTQVDGLLLPLSRAITKINDTLHEGALYAGYATPETIPTEHEGASLFYIATEAGEYTHFFSNGDIPVVIPTAGIHLIVGGIEADDWNYETIVTFTNNVQFNNAQLITSGGVFNAILPINELLHRNYMLAGVAYTTTIPTEDTNVFYLAGQGGTYTHFLDGNEDPLVLPKGFTVIYRGVEDDGWNYWTIYADNDFINTNRAQALTSNQQTEAQNNLEGKSYVPAQFSGLGKKMLAKNILEVSGVEKNVLTQDMFQDEFGNDLENTVFVVKYDYEAEEAINIPDGSVLEFDGGSIKEGTIIGTNTKILSDKANIFGADVNITGTWDIPVVHSEWIENCTAPNRIRQAVNLMSAGSKLVVGDGVYNLNLANEDFRGIILPANSELQLSGELKATTNGLTYYEIVVPGPNCHIIGGKITGDSDTSTASSGEHGFGIRVDYANVCIENVEISECWGDGIYVTNQCRIVGCNIHHCRRQGISVIKGKNIAIVDNVFSDIAGTNPSCCIDLEPNSPSELIEDILIKGNKFNNDHALLLTNRFWQDDEFPVKNVIIQGNISQDAFTIGGIKNVIVSDNIIKTSSYVFVNVQGSKDVSIDGNHFESSTEITRYERGIVTNEYCKNIFVKNNHINFTMARGPIRIQNCIFSNNHVINADVDIRYDAVVSNNFINGICQINLNAGQECRIKDNMFNITGNDQLLYFLLLSGANGSLYFCHNHVLVKNPSIRYFYFIDSGTNPILENFTEKDNVYNIPIPLGYHEVHYTNGMRLNNRTPDDRSHFNDEYSSLDYTFKYGKVNSLTGARSEKNADGFTYGKAFGRTDERPVGLEATDEGFKYYDNTISKTLYFNAQKKEKVTDILVNAGGGTGYIQNTFNEGEIIYIEETSYMGEYSFSEDGTFNEDTAVLISSLKVSKPVNLNPSTYPYIAFRNTRSSGAIRFDIYKTKEWVEADGAVAGVLRSGAFADKPSSSDIYVGFRYFCIDKQTTEGSTDGIDIIYKETSNGNDVWVDALGRIIS